MIARYIHILKNLPGILNRLETELQSKATKASVDTLRFTVTKKADVEFVVNLSGIINERFAERPTMADLSQAKIDLGVRIDDLEKEVETLALNAVKTDQPSFADSLRELVRNGQITPNEANARLAEVGMSVLPPLGHTGVVLDKGALELAALDRVIQSSRPVADIDHLVKAPKKPRAPKGGAK